jgi:hypothetical protein
MAFEGPQKGIIWIGKEDDIPLPSFGQNFALPSE